jgi:lipopolysaccharide/colanic/teichoic acid biosynthesis glycosyltransferase
MTAFLAKTILPWRSFVRLKKSNRSAGRARWHGLHSPEKVGVILARERARTDRTAEGFSLLVLGGGDFELRQAAAVLVDKGHGRCLRSTDEVGWLDPHRLCAILLATPVTGAWKVSDDLAARLTHLERPLTVQVYYYPSESWPRWEPAAETQEQTLRRGGSVEPLETHFVQRVPAWKRSLDVVGAVTALLLLVPLFVVTVAAIKICMPGPVLFKQRRSGRGGMPFTMYKFRSMVVDAERQKRQLLSMNEQDGPAFKIESDPRITGLGRLLRRTSIDELPQFWNVLKGDMSLVGPRPLPCDETANCHPWQRRRLDVTPGMTCIWQVQGRSTVSFAEWVRMDIRYIHSPSLVKDVKLLLQTVPALVFSTGR